MLLTIDLPPNKRYLLPSPYLPSAARTLNFVFFFLLFYFSSFSYKLLLLLLLQRYLVEICNLYSIVSTRR